MQILQTSLFANPAPRKLGVGYHNVGNEGVLRASDEATVNMVQHYYGQRCGHLPLDAGRIRVLVESVTEEIRTQMAYLSKLFGKEVRPVTQEALKQEAARVGTEAPLVVPYINVPELETRLRTELGAETWGLPGAMTHILKNKASFYKFAGELGLDGFFVPDFAVAHIFELAGAAEKFLAQIEEVYKTTGMAGKYPLGLMLRASEEDGNYGSCLAHEDAGRIVAILDGDAESAHYYRTWPEALKDIQAHLSGTMNAQKETRVVMSRFIDFADSPGMSVVIMHDRVESLGWNGQLQKPGSRACVGTSTYVPKNAYMQRMQKVYEEQTAAYFEALLRSAARKCGIDFAAIRGVANLDIMIPGEMEQRLQQARKQAAGNYLAECNPRWTNYTDAIMVVLGANRKQQTIANMREVIAAGISTIDKHPLPQGLNPQRVRERIAEQDERLRQEGTRVICRMAKNPMGLILAGDVKRAQETVDALLQEMHA